MCLHTCILPLYAHVLFVLKIDKTTVEDFQLYNKKLQKREYIL